MEETKKKDVTPSSQGAVEREKVASGCTPVMKGAVLDPKKLLELFDETGPLKKAFQSFELRPEQKSMLLDVIDAYNGNKVALIEAGTGCGKSLAYLLPALILAAKHQERTVISTNTINLQEQLFLKDIPLLLKALQIDLKVVLMKGMGNYICLKKFHEAFEERLLYPPEERNELEKISGPIDNLKEGSRTELPVLSSVWDKINAEHDLCTHKECPYYENCYFFKARKEAEDAQILILNHHLLFADISLKANEERSLIPSYQRLIIDEAHNIEEVATDYFAAKVTRLGLLKTIGRLTQEKGHGKGFGKLHQLKEKIEKTFPKGIPEEMQRLISRLQIDLPGLKKDALLSIQDLFQTVQDYLVHEMDEEMKVRIQKKILETYTWQEKWLPRFNMMIQSLTKVSQGVKFLDQDISSFDHERLQESTKGVRHEMGALAVRLQTSADTLQNFISATIPENKVRWIEQTNREMNTAFIDASLDLSKLFADHLFMKHQTVILTSATLTSKNSFEFIKDRLGIPLIKKPFLEKIYPSPFNYQNQVLVVCPTDLPPPDHSDFLNSVEKPIIEAVRASKGGAFILFTSYSMLKSVYNRLEPILKKEGFILLKHGDMSRQLLIENFKSSHRAILFGTDSFWEGVDVAGHALRLVIIMKLPFKVPTEPIIQARHELLTSKGKDPFKSYTLPQAIVKFKQGFGRLIRTHKDRGCVLILDSRIKSRYYGQDFLKSLPKTKEAFIPLSLLGETLLKFFQRKG